MFTPEDRRRLNRFCEVADNIRKCRFIADFHKQAHHIFVGTLPDGTVVDEYPRYDEDDLRSFLTHYRQLRLEKEPTNLLAIMKLLKRKGDPNDKVLFDAYRTEIKEEGRCWWGASVTDENGQKQLLDQENVESLLLYGEVFHTDWDKHETLRKVIGSASIPKALAFFNYMRFARTVVGCARRTADVIRQRGYLK